MTKNLCPYDKKECIGKDCSIFLTLTSSLPNGERAEVGRCSHTWTPLLQIESRLEIAKLVQGSVLPKEDPKLRVIG